MLTDIASRDLGFLLDLVIEGILLIYATIKLDSPTCFFWSNSARAARRFPCSKKVLYRLMWKLSGTPLRLAKLKLLKKACSSVLVRNKILRGLDFFAETEPTWKKYSLVAMDIDRGDRISDKATSSSDDLKRPVDGWPWS